MGLFDFINDEDFRNTLESDYRELESSMKSGAWKAVHVLAGSIIEAMLIDCLISINYKNNQANILKMDLGQVINACQTESILSQRATDLSSVIRTYRNLIHPGRMIRLNEKVDENSAIIAKSLVNIIVNEVATKMQLSYGFTAQQIISKIEGDNSAIAILGDLLQQTNPTEIERLLLKKLPERYIEITSEMPDSQDDLNALSNCYRIAFDMSPDEIKKKCTQKFVVAVKRERGQTVTYYGNAFFRATDLDFLDQEDAILVKKHLIHRMEENLSDNTLNMIDGLLSRLNETEASRFIDAIIKTLSIAISEDDTEYINRIVDYLVLEQANTSGEIDILFVGRIDAWLSQNKHGNRYEFTKTLRQIQFIFDPIPF
ncbi:MAG: hypothetical protein OT477_09710 [Chloroflexi bacterium]|nr:hypothetical protein [Chloroflexota bacterium]